MIDSSTDYKNINLTCDWLEEYWSRLAERDRVWLQRWRGGMSKLGQPVMSSHGELSGDLVHGVAALAGVGGNLTE